MGLDVGRNHCAWPQLAPVFVALYHIPMASNRLLKVLLGSNRKGRIRRYLFLYLVYLVAGLVDFGNVVEALDKKTHIGADCTDVCFAYMLDALITQLIIIVVDVAVVAFDVSHYLMTSAYDEQDVVLEAFNSILEDNYSNQELRSDLFTRFRASWKRKSTTQDTWEDSPGINLYGTGMYYL